MERDTYIRHVKHRMSVDMVDVMLHCCTQTKQQTWWNGMCVGHQSQHAVHTLQRSQCSQSNVGVEYNFKHTNTPTHSVMTWGEAAHSTGGGGTQNQSAGSMWMSMHLSLDSLI
jgi:hypothetical protein